MKQYLQSGPKTFWVTLHLRSVLNMPEISMTLTICPEQSRSATNNKISTHGFNKTKEDIYFGTVCGIDHKSVKVPLYFI